MFTVITRTANRPRFFGKCRQSVLSQTRPTFHLVITDDPADQYPVGDFVALVERKEGRGHNTYFNEVRQHIPDSHPWVIFLDDDDAFAAPDALACIAGAIRDSSDLVLWQVQFPDCILPGKRFGLPPAPGQITGIGFCYHKSHWLDWPPVPLGDFAVIQELYQTLRPVWLNSVLTKMQTGPGHGLRLDLE